LLASFESAPTGELQAAQALGLSFSSRVVHIYLPNAFLLITANLNAAFTLNYKVVIAAEVLGQVGVYSIGSNILTAKQSLDFSGAFVWLVISVLLAFGLDYACKKLHQCIYARTLGSVV
jgi:ABC-type nitrate/sulfonate/bicarbonate transport system permease component